MDSIAKRMSEALVGGNNLPCPDPEGCKHFKAEQELQSENEQLKEQIAQSDIEIKRLKEALRITREHIGYGDCAAWSTQKEIDEALKNKGGGSD